MTATTKSVRLAAVVATACAVGLVLNRVAGNLPSHAPSGHWETPLSVVTLGVITGMTLGLAAVGLVLIYRTNRIINFAHGEIGALGAAVMGLAVTRWHIA